MSNAALSSATPIISAPAIKNKTTFCYKWLPEEVPMCSLLRGRRNSVVYRFLFQFIVCNIAFKILQTVKHYLHQTKCKIAECNSNNIYNWPDINFKELKKYIIYYQKGPPI